MEPWVWTVLGMVYLILSILATVGTWCTNKVLGDDEDDLDVPWWEYVLLFFFWPLILLFGWASSFLEKSQPAR